MNEDYFRISVKNMKHRKLRSFLTLIGIMISIATIFVLVSVSLGLEKTIQDEFEKLGGDKFFIQPRGQFGPPGADTGAQLTDDDVEVIKKVSGVDEVSVMTISPSKVEFKKTIKFVNVIGIDPETQELAFGSYDLDEGRFFKGSETGKIVVGSQYLYNDFLGKPVTIGDKIELNEVEFKVVGIVEQTGSPPDDRQIYMAMDDFRVLYEIPDRVDYIIAQVQEGTDINKIADNVERKLMKHRDVDDDTVDFTILTPEELLETFGTVLNIVTYFLFGIATISLFVGGINIANTMFTSVLERTKDIGVMKAIGARNSDILTIFLIEAGILGVIGGSLGIVFGYGICQAIEYIAANIYNTSLLTTFSPISLVVGLIIFAFLAGAVSGLYPAWKATKIKPVEALRYE